MTRTTFRCACFALAAAGTLAAIFALPASAATPSDHEGAGVLPPQTRHYGHTYTQWSERWWQWSLEAQDVPSNPNVDPNAGTPSAPEPVDCTLGQSGPVWFVPGVTFYQTDAPNYRSCSVPEGTSLFFPLIDSWQDNTSCPGTPPTTLTGRQLRKSLEALNTEIIPGSMSATIDGHAVGDISSLPTAYHVAGGPFSYTLPANNALSRFCSGNPFPAGTTVAAPGAFANGVYVMTTPLGEGRHTIHLGAQAQFGSTTFTEDVTYDITVRDSSSPASPGIQTGTSHA